jgi:hypothetical protein
MTIKLFALISGCLLLIVFSCNEQKKPNKPNPYGLPASNKLYQECIRFSFNPRFTCVEADNSSIQLFMITAQDPAYDSYRGEVFGEILWGNVKLCIDDMVITCDSARWIPADSVLSIDGTVVFETPNGTLKGSGLAMHVSDRLWYAIYGVTLVYELEAAE